MRAPFLLAGLIGAFAAHDAGAADSAYTKFDWEKCRKTGAEDDVIMRRCNGPDGIAVDINSGADAAFVSFGAKGARGDTQLGEFYFPKDTVEWRKAAGKPFAAILRYDVGKASYFEILDSQQQLFPAEASRARAKADQLIAVVSLYKALGGGWHVQTDQWAPGIYLLSFKAASGEKGTKKLLKQ